MSIGPALPPHLLAQATPNLHSDDSDGDDVAGPSLPPASLGPSLPPGLAGTSSASTRVNENEDGGTGDAYASSISAGYANGSRAPVGPHRPSAASIGPMPPAVAAGRAPSAPAPADEDDEDDYVPALPPGFARPGPSASTASAAVPRAAPSARRPVAGPTMPGRGAPAPALDDDSDDDVGPRPLPVGLTTTKKDAAAEFREREEARRKAVEESLAPKKLVRDEWMLKPPSASELLNNIDPTKIIRGGRKFNASVRGGPAPDKAATASSLWTETPAERAQRLADEVSGKRRRMENADPDAGMGEEERAARAKRRRAEDEVRAGVEAHTKSQRGGALVDQHASAVAAGPADDDEKSVIWEHSRDMALGGRLMDDAQRGRIINDSKGLDSRFSSGKGGSFL